MSCLPFPRSTWSYSSHFSFIKPHAEAVLHHSSNPFKQTASGACLKHSINSTGLYCQVKRQLQALFTSFLLCRKRRDISKKEFKDDIRHVFLSQEMGETFLVGYSQNSCIKLMFSVMQTTQISHKPMQLLSGG